MQMQWNLVARGFTLAAALLVLGLSLGFAGCGGDDESVTDGAATDAATAGLTTPFDDADLVRLLATEVPGYTKIDGPAASTVAATIVYRKDNADESPQAMVTLQACKAHICWDLSEEITDEREQTLKSNLSTTHIENPGLDFEHGRVELMPGHSGFFTYARSFVQKSGSTAKANTYTVLYHDGVNAVTVLISPNYSAGSDTEAEMEALMDQAMAEATAREIFAAFAEEFSPNE